MASKPEIIDTIEALAVHCRPPLMTVEDREKWMRTWCEDLGQYPADAIATACRNWRQGSTVKFPTPGQLLPLVRSAMPRQAEVNHGPWRPLDDAEYRNLTVREKIRHQLIIASEARRRAGPMCRNPPGSTSKRPKLEHLTPDEMPDIWKRWTAIAEGHLSEAARLREILRSSRNQAA